MWSPTSPPRWISPRIGGFSFSRVPRPRSPFSRRLRPSRLFLNGGRVALVARHHVDLVDLHLAVEPRLGLALNQALAKLFGHGLDIALAEIEFLGDLPVRQVETHEVQAQHPDPQRLVMAGQNRAGQVVETRLAGLAQPDLARGTVVIAAGAAHGAAATR